MDKCGWSCILHQNRLLLIALEVGIPLCIGVCHAQDRCTSPTPCKPTSEGSEDVMMPQESSGQAVTQCPASKTSLGWINGKLWLLLWMSTGASTEDGWRHQVTCSRHRYWKEHIHVAKGMMSLSVHAIRWWTPGPTQLLIELGHGFARPKGGVYWVSTPHVRRMDELAFSSLMQSTPTHMKRDPCHQQKGGFIPSLYWMRWSPEQEENQN